jgi:acyl carrier protein
MEIESRNLVLAVARSLGVLDAAGNLTRLDSLMVVDFALALEEKLGTEIPAMSLTLGVFQSIDSITELVTELTVDRERTDAV